VERRGSVVTYTRSSKKIKRRACKLSYKLFQRLFGACQFQFGAEVFDVPKLERRVAQETIITRVNGSAKIPSGPAIFSAFWRMASAFSGWPALAQAGYYGHELCRDGSEKSLSVFWLNSARAVRLFAHLNGNLFWRFVVQQ
jgi:hypothetical protein